ncbi:lipase [Baekduia alba]|uniref:GDSL-type esterase/lipase family protein n=1 Tax=Baekduia alba TaxID=2997333 RepID=UPI00234177A4|nr:GDSL-type esterase/lipase family protein [Baekduia alba]WCB94498.1 lipase [Baekduia alba]
MASVTLKNDRFPAGTSVSAYLRSDLPAMPDPPSGAPSGPVAVSTGLVGADGSLSFSGLADGAKYVAYAQVSGQDRFVQFRAPRAPVNAAVGSRVFFVGDSQIQKGLADSLSDGTGTSYAPLLQGRAWYAWAMMLSEGQLLYAGQAATGGATTATIIANGHHTAAAAQSAKLVAVLAGRNDIVLSVPFATTIANLKTIFDTIAAAGKIPILCTLPAQPVYPTATAAQRTAAAQINAWIRKYALSNNWPLPDFEDVTTDPTTGGQKAGMMLDASHPGPGLGARTMGAEFYNKLKSYLVPQKPLHAIGQPNTGDLNLIPNPLNLTLTGAAGTDPTGWAAATETGTGTFTTYDPATTGSDGLGLWARLARTSGSGVMRRALTPKIAVTPGDFLEFSFRFKTASLEANGAWATLQLVGYAAIGDDPAAAVAQYLGGIKSWRGDVATPGLYSQPPSQVAAGINYVSVVAILSSGSGAANIDFGQMGLANLTQMGALS